MLDPKLQESLIQKNRELIKGYRDDDPYLPEFESDQERKLPQPPLVKPAMMPKENIIKLPKEFSDLPMK